MKALSNINPQVYPGVVWGSTDHRSRPLVQGVENGRIRGWVTLTWCSCTT